MNTKTILASVATVTALVSAPALAGELYGAIDLRDAPASALSTPVTSASDLAAGAAAPGVLYGFDTISPRPLHTRTATRAPLGDVTVTGELYGFDGFDPSQGAAFAE